ncbi:MAG: hypothetical protein WBA07_09010 [Rivularia sp. (in: cyanobacteria)]
MLSYQQFLTAAIEFICAAFTIVMIFDFITVLVYSWNQSFKYQNDTLFTTYQKKLSEETDSFPYLEATTYPESADIETFIVEAEDTQTNLNRLATEEELLALTLRKLKQLAANYSIPGRTSMTKNLKTAQKLLTPKLLGLVTVAEI